MLASSSQCTNSLCSLPTELIVHIFGDDSLSFRDRANISLTCRLLHCINNPILYGRNIQHDASSCLFWAAHRGRVATLQRALDAGADLNTEGWLTGQDSSDVDAGLTTPLHVAAKYGTREVAEWLIDHGANIDAASYEFCDALAVYWKQYFNPIWRPGWTPLFAALNNEQTSTSELLVTRQAQLTNLHTGRSDLSIPALHVAAANGMNSIIKMLSLRTGFDVNSRDFNGNTALHYTSQYWPHCDAEENHLLSPIPLLLSLGADMEATNNRLQSPLIHACWMGNYRAATILVRAGANPKAECYVREVQKLVRPLYLACLDRADIERQSGSEPHEEHSAWEMARTELIHALIAAGINVNDRLMYRRLTDIPTLQRVCLDNDYLAASVLMRVAGADVDATDGQGQTPLLSYLRHYGQRPPYLNSSSQIVGIVSLLLAHGARLDTPDENGCDALQQVIDWALTNSDWSNCLPTILRNAQDVNVSEARVEAAISVCGDKIISNAVQSRETYVANMLLDFRQVTWGHGRLL